MAGEVLAFVDYFHAGYDLQQDLRTSYGKDVSIKMFTNSKQIYDAITKGKRTTDMSKMLDLMAMREAYQRFEIHSVCFIKGVDNPADSLTKSKYNGRLNSIMMTGVDNTNIVEWVKRIT